MSVNMSEMFDNFWTNSMFIKPEGRDVVCHPTAWDMGNKEDFRWGDNVVQHSVKMLVQGSRFKVCLFVTY